MPVQGLLYLYGRADLIKISNLVKGEEEIITCLYSSLEGTERAYDRCSKLAC